MLNVIARRYLWIGHLGKRLVGVAMATTALLACHAAQAQSPPTLVKAFGAASIAIGQSTSLTFTVGNPPAGTPLTNIIFFDSLPSGMVVANPTGLVNNCGGSINNVSAGATVISMSGVNLAPGASCTWKVDVAAFSAGAKDNTTTAVTSNESAAGGTASASLTVQLPSPPTLSKAFGAASIAIGQSTSLTFTVGNPNATFTTLTNIIFFDSLPSGMVVANPTGLVNNCGGSINNVSAGDSVISMSGVNLAPGASCTWKVDVAAISAGAKNNTTSATTSNESAAGGTASASLNVLGMPGFVGASSRKTHGTAGTFDLPLAATPLNPTTEPRAGPTQTIVMTFDRAIVSADNPTISEGAATFGSMSFSGNDVTMNFTGVTNPQYVTFNLTNVTATDGGTGGTGSVRVGFLFGDVTQSRQVTVSDVGTVNSVLLQAVSNANFLKDVNVDGKLTVSDVGLTNANLLKKLPAP